MFIRMQTSKSTRDCSAQLQELRQRIDAAGAILIGAGAGLSTSAGFVYDGERFDQNFADFRDKYHFEDMYTGGFYPYAAPEEYWAYWSRYIWINRYLDAPEPVYQDLLALVEDKDYFVLTTNVDHCFQKAGFDKERLFYTQGDYGLFQCSEPCCQETWGNEDAVRQMMERQREMRIPSELIPRCPRCGKPLAMNLRSDDRFVQDEGWYKAARRYEDFVRGHKGCAVLYLELGVGFNTPGIIKYNLWRQTAQNPNAFYVCVNKGQAAVPPELSKRSLCLDIDIKSALNAIKP